MDSSRLLPEAGKPSSPASPIDEDAILARVLEKNDALGIDAEQPLWDTVNGCWVLFVYCCFSTFQCTLWALPGPMSTTMGLVYPNAISAFDSKLAVRASQARLARDHLPRAVQLFLNWGAICFIPCAFPFAYWLARPHGLRRCTIIGILLITAGAACRCGAQTDSTLSLALWHLSSILVGCAGPIAMAAPILLAETWFPVHRRGLAMAIAAEANSIGGAIAFLMPPALLQNNSLADLNRVYALSLGLALFCCVCCLYFPDAPSVPPSRSAEAEDSASRAVTFSSMWAATLRLARDPQVCC